VSSIINNLSLGTTMRRRAVGDVLWCALALSAIGTTVALARGRFGPLAEPDPMSQPRFVRGGARLAEAGHVLGPLNASVRIVEFADFECPACRALQRTLRELRKRHPGTVAVIYRHYPLAGHFLAMPAAVAAECAAVQGRFESYADLLFEKQDSLNALSWSALAASAGVSDTARFETCPDLSPHFWRTWSVVSFCGS